MEKIRALVVDDDRKFCASLGNCLRTSFGCEVSLCYSGNEAIQLLENGPYHLVLIDIKMPGINGFIVLEKAMQKYPGVISFIISGLNDAAISNKAEEMGAWFVSKPVEFPALEHLLKMLLKEKKLIP